MSVVLTVISLGTRVALAYVLSAMPALGVTGIWWAVPIGWALADAAGLIITASRCSALLDMPRTPAAPVLRRPRAFRRHVRQKRLVLAPIFLIQCDKIGTGKPERKRRYSMPEGKRVRRTPQQMAQDLDAQMEKLNASIAELEEKKLPAPLCLTAR